MKKLFTLSAIMLFGLLANAQNEEQFNNFILGGSINFLTQNNTSYPYSSLNIISGIGGIPSSSTNDSKNTTFAITPYFGKEINKNWLFGVQLNYRLGRYHLEDAFVFGQNDPVDFERNSNQIGIGIFGRYLVNPEQKFNFFLQPFLEYNVLNEEELRDNSTTQEKKVNYIEAGIGAGVLYNINDKVRVILRIGDINYVNGKWEIVDTDTEQDFSSFGLNVNLTSIFFGFELSL